MAVSTKEYYDGVLKQAGVSEAKRQALITQLEDEEVAKALANEQIVPRMRHDEYSREMDKLKGDQKKTGDYYQSLVTWKAEQDQILAAALAANGQQPQTVQQVQPDLTAYEKKWEEKLAQRDGQMIGLLKTGMSLASRHAVEFKEALDVDAIEKIAVDKKLSLQQAYDDYVAPRRLVTSDELRKTEIAKAREEGAREFASKHKIPVDTQPREHHVIFDRDPKKQVGADDYVPNSGQLSPQSTRALRDNFVEAWESVPASNTSGT